MDFRAAVIASLDKLLDTGAVQAMIEKHLAKAFEEAISSELRSYSDFGKQVQASVREALALRGPIDLPSYNGMILAVVRRLVETQTRASVEKQVAENLKDLLTPAPERITLSKLVETYIEHIKAQHDAGCVCYGEQNQITLLVEAGNYGNVSIGLDKEPGQRRAQCDIELGVTKEGKLYWLRFRDDDVEKRMFAGPFYGFERALFQMKAAGTILEFDADPADINTYYGADA